jgi:uncharacterized membrane protein YdcZ (DUF606 family)
MNPFGWSREHQLAVFIAALIGAALATVLGYLVYSVGWGEGALPFENWIWRLLRGPIWWALFGAVIGSAFVFVRNLLHAPIGSAGSDTAIARSSRPSQDPPQDRPQGSSRLPRSRL